MTTPSLPTSLFLALAAIVAAAHLVGQAGRRWLGQPPVVGEMIAGILLGPSVLGALLPGAEAALFPSALKPLLGALAQLGVGLYMFVVGLEFRREGLRESGGAALAVSLAGMGVPFLLGAAAAPWLLAHGGLFGPGLGMGQATLFLGACLAITAFPMLARIIKERGLAGTPLGTLALTAGAIDDACAWAALAVVLASIGGGIGGGIGGALVTIGGGIGFFLLAGVAGPRLLAPLARLRSDTAPFVIGLVLFLLAAWAMDTIGLHAVFGGFLLGTAMPRGRVAEALRTRLEPVTVALLLPIFFTYSGLNTRIALLLAPGLLAVTAAIVALAILAKFGACWGAARLAGKPQGTALGLGALMNARGLMELILIGIGLQRGLLTPALYTILVLMAALTTLATGPLFTWSQRARR